jgi:selenide, water dikinase
MKNIDLLESIEQGGCSAKLSPSDLAQVISGLPFLKKKELLVGSETCDDAAVWKINSDTAIIQTTDFFPPLCSDPYTFGQIAAANALSDIYSMGGKAILALNLVMFPAKDMDLSVLRQILLGGAEKVAEAGAVLAGGHTIDDSPPKYGLAVTGIVHPDKIIRNCTAVSGDKLILTKPIGSGVLLAGDKIKETNRHDLEAALNNMKQLNKAASELMNKYCIKCATDITGFGLLGHAYEVAAGSGAILKIETSKIPLLKGAYDLVDFGCIPGASFRNLKHIEMKTEFNDKLDYNLKMLACDAQTSGGLLICCPEKTADSLVQDLIKTGYNSSSIIGEVLPLEDKNIRLSVS